MITGQQKTGFGPPPRDKDVRMTLQVAYLISQYPALSHTFILREIQKLEALGCTVHIASVNPPDRPMDGLSPEERTHARETFYIKKAGVRGGIVALMSVLRANPRGLLKGLFEAVRLGGLHPGELLLYLFYWIEALMVVRWARRLNVRHIHVHFASAVASVGMLSRIIGGGLLSITVHGPDELSDVTRHRLQRKFAVADRIICITDYARSRVMLHANYTDWAKIRVVRVGLHCAPFLRLGENRASRAAGSRSIRLLSIGRLSAAKGQIVLLEALAELRKRQCPVHLTLIGGGPMERIIRNTADQLGLLPDFLTLTGGLNQESVRQYFRETDLFVLGSFAEGLPVVLMEALLSGLPCVSTTIAGIPELIRHEKDGLLTPAGNALALADAIQKLSENPSLAKALAESGRDRVLEMHDINRTGVLLRACFSELQQTARKTAPFLPDDRADIEICSSLPRAY